MSPKRVMQFGGIALIAFAVLLVVRTGDLAVSLGATPGVAPFWFQLTFMRLFATALAGLGAIFLWSAVRLSEEQLTSFLKMGAGVLSALGLMALTQPNAVWSSGSGWALAALFVVLAVICGASSLRPVLRHDIPLAK